MNRGYGVNKRNIKIMRIQGKKVAVDVVVMVNLILFIK
ncbi:hypothetical protein EV214_1136 [Marinisporobacter balticus]|uniref:Uncharacterized protein n=1 Tax=Marinisporobacter balticus TaxID=2018667 RepID=A0A4R2KL20_9FIRM|nr:hypothetical protein EV214_1136 [Marinisporobacter balticus]